MPCSVSDGSIKELSSLSYISVDWVVEQVVRLGRGALLAKLDIQSTYRNSQCVLKIAAYFKWKWKRQLFVDCALLASGKPAKFYSTSRCSRVGCFSQRGTGHCTLPGWFIMWDTPPSRDCTEILRTLLKVCSELGIPVASQKCQGPTTRLVFLQHNTLFHS